MTYRSAEDALREKTTALETELRGLEEKRKSAASIDAEVGRVVEELRKSRTLLDRIEKKRALPMLDQVRVASPCNADWNAMVGDDRSRFCGKCEKNVYNLSAMTREDAELLMLEKDGRLCIRLFRRADGTVITEDCPVGVRKKRLRLVGVLAIGGSLAASAAGYAVATHGAPPSPPVRIATMGESAIDETPLPSASAVPASPDEPPRVEMGKRSPEPVPPPKNKKR